MSLEKYKSSMHKRLFRSSYGDSFNNKLENGVKFSESVLEYQKFSELKCTSYLNDQVRSYLDKWQQLDQDKHYQQLVHKALSSLFTFVKSSLPAETIHKLSYQKIGNTSK